MAKWSFFLIFVQLFSIIAFNEGKRVPIGGPCTDVEQCDVTLDCISGTCNCASPPDEFLWDEPSQACLLKEGAKCVAPPGPGNGVCHYMSFCRLVDGDHVCVCKEPYRPSRDGICLLGHDSKCRQTIDLCDRSEFLHCGQEFKCDCLFGQLYDTAAGHCKILPGSDCNDSTDSPPCCDGSSCNTLNLKCTCDGFSKPSLTDPSKCVISHGNPCSETNDSCDKSEGLVCSEGVCTCVGEGINSEYDSESSSCYRLADEVCDEIMECTPNAKCFDVQGTKVCKCLHPYFKNIFGNCHITYGGKCSSSDTCDPTQPLTCNWEGRCDCMKGFYYVSSSTLTGSCQILPGYPCNSTGAPCVEGSHCDPAEGHCICTQAGSAPSRNDPSKCVLNHGQNCLMPADICDYDQGLQCLSGKCLCIGEGTSSFYNHETQSCNMLANQECHENIPCVPNAFCSNEGNGSVCKCITSLSIPLKPNKNGYCQLQYEDPCSSTNDLCDPLEFLKCSLDGTCSCANDSYFDKESGTCRLLPNSFCENKTESQKCSPHTNCVLKQNGTFCSCPFNGSPSIVKPWLCVVDARSPCDPHHDLCDPFKHLTCQYYFWGWQCGCRISQESWYDIETNYCYIKAGSTCILTKGSQLCTPNADCLQSGVTYPRCTCKYPFVQNKVGKCFLPYLAKCNSKNDLCDPYAFLSCNLFGKCSCSENEIYNQTISACQILADRDCVAMKPEGINGSPSCVPNSHCDKGVGKCMCKGDMTPNSEGFCRLEYGRTCDIGIDLCNSLNNLECDEDANVCVCRGEKERKTWFNNFQQKCFVLAGSTCTRKYAGIACVPNAVCDPISEVCTCNGKLNLTKNAAGFCRIPFGNGCLENIDLCDGHGFLHCKEDKERNSTICLCQRQFETFYDFTSSTCRLISDRPCEPRNEGRQMCDRNAECASYGTGNSTFRCRCKETYHPNAEKICFTPYRANCNEKEDECDPVGPLICRKKGRLERQCLCPEDEMIYNYISGKCLALPQMSCGSNNIGCVENAICINDRCRCQEEFEISPKGKCLKKHGASCQINANCNEEMNLICGPGGNCTCRAGFIVGLYQDRIVCYPGHLLPCEKKAWPEFQHAACSLEALLQCHHDGKCQCRNPEIEIFHGAEKQCRRIPRAPCRNETEPCIPGANCVMIEGEENGICICEKGQGFSRTQCSLANCIKMEWRALSIAVIAFKLLRIF